LIRRKDAPSWRRHHGVIDAKTFQRRARSALPFIPEALMTRLLRTATTAALLLPCLTWSTAAAAPPAKAARTVTVHAGDDLKFSLTRIDAAPGERIRLVLISTGKLPKTVMGHNIVILKKGSDPAAFANASATARTTDYIGPSVKAQVLAHTPLVGPGETVETTFQAPATPGKYDFLCSFPGHFIAGMKGTLVVAKRGAAPTN
jgi:azurin